VHIVPQRQAETRLRGRRPRTCKSIRHGRTPHGTPGSRNEPHSDNEASSSEVGGGRKPPGREADCLRRGYRVRPGREQPYRERPTFGGMRGGEGRRIHSRRISVRRHAERLRPLTGSTTSPASAGHVAYRNCAAGCPCDLPPPPTPTRFRVEIRRKRSSARCRRAQTPFEPQRVPETPHDAQVRKMRV
jgi:hypothetical protein